MRNDQAVDLQLRIDVSPDQARSTLWGSQPNPLCVEIESSILEELPAPDAEGMPGYRAQTIRRVHDEAGRGRRQTYCAKSYYAPCNYRYYPRPTDATGL